MELAVGGNLEYRPSNHVATTSQRKSLSVAGRGESVRTSPTKEKGGSPTEVGSRSYLGRCSEHIGKMYYISTAPGGLQYRVDHSDRAGTYYPPPKSPARLFFSKVAGRLVATLGDERIGAPKTPGKPAGLLGSARLEPGEDGENGRHYQKRDTKQDED